MFLNRKRVLRNRLDSNFFSPYYPPTKCQKYFDSLMSDYYNQTGTHQWNYTISPNPKQTAFASSPKTYGQLTDLQLFSHFKRNILKEIILRKTILPYIREYSIFYEYGDKNGKPHCNLVLLMEPNTPDKHHYYILNRLKIYGISTHAVQFKNQKNTFKSPDIYNQKDVSYMLTLNIRPTYRVNKQNQPHYLLMQSIINRVPP